MPESARELCQIGRRAARQGLVDGIAGNISLRLTPDRILCTPTMCNKGRLRPADLCVIDTSGKQVDGVRRPSSEMRLHLAIYAADSNIQSIVHTHPPYATTLGVLGVTPPTGVVGEADVLLGPVPLVAYQTMGTPDLAAAVQAVVPGHVAALLANHGAVTWGTNLESAYLRTETLESFCRVVYHARLAGPIQTIPPDKQAALTQLREQLRNPAT